MAEPFPLVEQAGVDLADQFAEPLGDVVELFGFGVLGHGLGEGLVGVGQVAQHEAFGAGQAVVGDVVAEGHGPFVEVPGHRLRLDPVVGDPGVALAVGVVGDVEQVGQGLRIGDRFEEGHALVVVETVGLHLGDGLAPGLVFLGGQDLAGVVESLLDHRQDVEGVGR